MRINEEDKTELLALSKSESMCNDARTVAENIHNPFMVNGEVDADMFIEFLTQYNEFLNHPRKPSEPFIEVNMKL